MKKIDCSKCLKLLLVGFVFFYFSNCDESSDVERKEPEITERLPKISIKTNGGTIVDEPKINASIEISELEVVTFEGDIGIEFRGATSQSFPKKSYGFETRDQDNNDLSVSFLEFPEEEDWILYAPYSDKTLFRNVLMYDLSREMGRYASRTKFVELAINNVEKGVYVLMEKLKRDKNRIDINKLKDDENSGEDLTGGYILKIDKLAGSNLGDGYNSLNSFPSQHLQNNSGSNREVNFLYEYPKPENITSEQKTYIATYINLFEDALASNDFKDAQLGYSAFIDTDSFIDFFLLNELSNNVDAYRLSTYITKDKSEKLKMGPIWDFNFALGNANYCNGNKTNTWAYQFNEHCPQYGGVPFWWERLLQDPAYVAKVKSRWNKLRGNAFSEAFIQTKIDSYELELKTKGVIDKNFQIWNILGSYIVPNNFVGATYDSEVEYLQKWIKDRLVWMDGAINVL